MGGEKTGLGGAGEAGEVVRSNGEVVRSNGEVVRSNGEVVWV